jgi:hypothetical protein
MGTAEESVCDRFRRALCSRRSSLPGIQCCRSPEEIHPMPNPTFSKVPGNTKAVYDLLRATEVAAFSR